MTTIDRNGSIHRGAGDGGGQFVGHARTAPAGDLTVLTAGTLDETVADTLTRKGEALRWGEVNVREGARTPWGPAGWVTCLGLGAVSVSTAGHGGVKLSPERNAAIPAPLRTGSGWYEEDCEIEIVVREFPELFPSGRRDPEAARTSADKSVRNWFPDAWEKTTGLQVQPGESTVRDEQLFKAATHDQHVTESARTADSDPASVVVSTLRASDGSRGEYLVPKSEYDAGRGDISRRQRFVVDPTRHAQLPPAPKPTVEEPVTHHHVPTAGERQQDRSLTSTSRDRIARDLGKRWRTAVGHVRSLEEIITDEGITGRTAHVDGSGKRTYALTQKQDGHNYSLQVSKATFDYFTAVPDTRTPSQQAQQDAYVYQAGLDRKFGGPLPRETARAHALDRRAQELYDAERAADIAQNGPWEDRDRARKETNAARERAARIPS